MARAVTAEHYPKRRAQRGQSTVEFVLVLPLYALMLLTVIQVGLLVRSRLLVTHAAREAVREAAVGGTDNAVRFAAVSAGDLDPYRLTVNVVRTPSRVTVELRYTDPTDVPMVGRLVGDAIFTTDATMRLE